MVLDVGEAYEMLLGRPWLRAAGSVHDWGTSELTMQLKSKKMSIDTRPTIVPIAYRPDEMYIAESAQIITKLKSTGIMPIVTLDLN